MRKPVYELIALDLDGTLTDSRKMVTQKTMDALRRASDAGVRVVLASGRPLQGVLPVAQAIDLAALGGYLLSENGARVMDAGGRRIFERTLPAGFVAELAAFARQYGVTALAYDDQNVVSENIEDRYVRYEARNDAMGLLKIDDFAKRVTWPLYKLMLVGDPEKLEPCANDLRAYYEGRLNNPYGIRQNPLGAQGAVSVFLWRLARGESLDIWGDGSVVRDYVFIEDLVDGIYRASISRTPSRIFNLGSGRGISLNQLLSVIRTVTGREAAVRYSGGRRFDVPEIYLDIERARRELGWEPATSLEDGIGRTWRQILEACRP